MPPAMFSGQFWRLPLFNFNQHQQGGISAVLFRCLMKRHHVWMLSQPQRRLLLKNMFTVAVHHAGTKHMFAATGGNQRPQLLFRLHLRQTMQIEKQLG